ncbi:hypothetical protein C8Q74DRAFT_575207 [Fomes fomentarius]|nr:hypothetical protein C8Q74DRAFT_575207 [Fomes fomentarius]
MGSRSSVATQLSRYCPHPPRAPSPSLEPDVPPRLPAARNDGPPSRIPCLIISRSGCDGGAKRGLKVKHRALACWITLEPELCGWKAIPYRLNVGGTEEDGRCATQYQ